jgi:hypothetical protein
MNMKKICLSILVFITAFQVQAQRHLVRHNFSQNISNPVAKISSIPGDENWDWRFDKPGVSNIVLSAFADSNDLYIGGNFTKAGTVDAVNIARYDGKRWYAMGSGIGGAQDGIFAIKKFGNYVYAAGSTGVHRWDGTTWTIIGTLSGQVTNGLAVNDIDVDANGNVYALGQFVQINGVTANCIAKWNGTAWSALGSGIGPFINGVYTGSVLCLGNNVYISGYFSTVGGVAANSVAKWNGSSWSALGNGTNGLTFLGVQGNNLIATGSFTTAGTVTASHVALWNGTAWSAMGAGFNYEGYDVCVYNNEIYVAGLFDHSGVTPLNYIAKWNGTSWVDAGNGFNIFTGQGLAKSSKYFIAFGGTGQINNIDMGSIAQWNGTKWITIGNGMNGTVYAMATWNNKILAGGNFTKAGGITANRFAMWDGNKWDTLLNEFTNGTIYAIAIMNNEIYVGGNFNLNNNLTSNYVAKWNGSHWVAVGGDVNYTVYTLEVDGNNLYAGGEFTLAGGAGANHIAKWDGSNWSALGNGTNNTVKSIKADGLGNLFVGGVFTTAGSTTVNRIAKWNGSAWSAMASGVNNIVNAVGISPAGDVYIGGLFDIGVNGNLLYRFAKFNGTSWVAVGGSFPTISNNVANIQFACGQLYVCGSLTTAQGNTVNCIARWDGSNWYNLGNGILFNNSIPQTYVNAMTSLGDDLYAGGIFNIAGDKPSQNIAHYKMEGFPEVVITNSTNAICKGDTITFTANAINAGAVPTYQWFVNGNNMASGSSFTSSALNNNDLVYCNVTTNPVCALPTTISSNIITVHADSLAIPVISLAGNTLTVTNPDANATYIWQVQQSGIWNDIIPQVTGVSYTYTNPGIYRARAEKGACEEFSNAVITTGILETQPESNFILFPNPANDFITIKIPKANSKTTLKIYNSTMQLIKTLDFETGIDNKISTGNFTNGIYFIDAISGGQSYKAKFVVSR